MILQFLSEGNVIIAKITCILVSSENRCKNTFVRGYFCIVFALPVE